MRLGEPTSRRRFRGAGVLMFLLTAAAALAQAQQLQVLSTDVTPSHQLGIDLLNESTKSAAAYVLEVKQFDASGKEVGDYRIGIDHVNNTANLPAIYQPIAPSQTSTEHANALPQAVTAQVTVVAVVYLDRTFDGDTSAASGIFAFRAHLADKLHQAVSLMSHYPSSSAEAETAVANLLAVDAGEVNAALKNTLGLPLSVDKRHPPTPAQLGTITRDKWAAISAELSKQADFWQAQSQEVQQ